MEDLSSYSKDVLVSIFRFLDPSALEHTIPLVCKCWNSLQLDGVWQVIVQEHLPERFWENRPSGKSNKEWYRFVLCVFLTNL